MEINCIYYVDKHTMRVGTALTKIIQNQIIWYYTNRVNKLSFFFLVILICLRCR